MSNSFDVIIAGGGPAGASAAIHLARRGARVLLAEQKKFPREKLCGEFISPECLIHFKELGVDDQMLKAQPSSLRETVFYSKNGRSVAVPSSWFQANGFAWGLSRSEMDECLLRRAIDAGAEVVENAQVVDVVFEDDAVRGVIVKQAGVDARYLAPITIDATGRARALARRVVKRRHALERPRASLVAFKAHLKHTRVAQGACEIYFYRGGYGGLSTIENGLSNLCFIASARDVRTCGADADRVMREVVCQNLRAAQTLAEANACSPWLAVSLENFGRHSLQPERGLLTIGDAASFIDPFTGSGMLMALESGELISSVLLGNSKKIRAESDTISIAERYRVLYKQRFDSRLRVCSLMRRAAFVPGLASLAIGLFGVSSSFRRRVTLATRFDSYRNC